LTSVKRPQSGNSGLISDLRSKTSLLEQPLQKWSPAKHLFVTQSSQPKSDLSALNLDWLSSVVIPTRGGTAARSRNSWGTPRGYPFKLKAAAASPLVAKECAAPVVCRLASGADAPKSVHSVLRLCRCAASRGVPQRNPTRHGVGGDKPAGGGCELYSSRPRRPNCPRPRTKRPLTAAPNQDAGFLACPTQIGGARSTNRLICGSSGHHGLADPVRLSGLSAVRAKISSSSSRPPAVRGRRRFCS
jgi:hypothetical protein